MNREEPPLQAEIDRAALMGFQVTNSPELDASPPSAAEVEAVGPGHHLAPWVAYTEIRNGGSPRGAELGQAIRAEPLVVGGPDPDRTCDLTIHRLWVARLEFRPDDEALATARHLLVEEHRLNAYRRGALHYGLGSYLAAQTPLRDLADLDEASENLTRSLSLSRTLSSPLAVARCQSTLALLQVPLGNPVVGEKLASEALSHALPAGGSARDLVERTEGPLPFWQIRALTVLQWARHYQGLQVDQTVVDACSAREQLWSSPVLACQVALVQALAALELGDVARARRAINHVQVDRRVNGIGLWRLPLAIVEAYTAVTQGDTRQTELSILQLQELPAPAEAALVRAIQLSHGGLVHQALRVLAPITSGKLHSASRTFPAAMALEAALLEELGRPEEADHSMVRAMGAAEPLNALRLFTKHGPEHLLVLARRAADRAPRNSWTATVRDYLESYISAPRDHAYDQPISTRLGPPAAGTRRGVEPSVGPWGPAAAASPLTPRELDVLRLVNEGITRTRIASELYISPNTVKTHLAAIRRKLGVARAAEAAAVARAAGWL